LYLHADSRLSGVAAGRVLSLAGSPGTRTPRGDRQDRERDREGAEADEQGAPAGPRRDDRKGRLADDGVVRAVLLVLEEDEERADLARAGPYVLHHDGQRDPPGGCDLRGLALGVGPEVGGEGDDEASGDLPGRAFSSVTTA